MSETFDLCPSKDHVLLVPTAGLTLHPRADLIPNMRPAEYRDLLADVKIRGIVTPLDVVGTVVLDGRHRLQAAKELGLIEVPVRRLTMAKGDEVSHLLKAAVLRRHLTDDQRAVIAAHYAKLNPRPRGGDRKSRSASRKIKSHHVVGFDRRHTPPAQATAATLMNVRPQAVEKAASVLNADPELADQVRSGKLPLSKALRATRRSRRLKLVANYEPPEGLFQVIVVTPPWPGAGVDGLAPHAGEPPYSAISVDDLCALKIPADDNCIIWLWMTNTRMRDAYRVLEAWGFEPKTVLTWTRDKAEPAMWLFNQTEHCILAVKGKPVVTLEGQTTLLHGAAGQGGGRPEEFFQLVESLCPAKSRLEMFARQPRDGWVSDSTQTILTPTDEGGSR